jgi:hypothetical protein
MKYAGDGSLEGRSMLGTSYNIDITLQTDGLWRMEFRRCVLWFWNLSRLRTWSATRDAAIQSAFGVLNSFKSKEEDE